MKTLNYILLLALFVVLFSCTNSEKQSELPVIDVTKSYPKKDIILQDIAEVEYIPLETRDDVLLSNTVTIGYLSNDTIIIGNKKRGDVFIFDGKGKLLSHFNHRGQGRGEYLNIFRILYNPEIKEMFIYTSSNTKKCMVYTINGEYKRDIQIKTKLLSPLRNLDDSTMIGYEPFVDFTNSKTASNKTPFFLVDKETGRVDTLKDFYISERKSDSYFLLQNGVYNGIWFGTANITNTKDGVVLDELFSDTIFLMNKDRMLIPILTKTPAIHQQGEHPTLITLREVTPKYFFISKEVYAYKKQEDREIKFLYIDRTNNEIKEGKLRNKDIQDQDILIKPYDNLLSADKLVDLLEEGKLKGKLKEIAEKINIDDNPVLVKVKFKE